MQLGVHAPHFPVDESHVGVQLATNPSGHVVFVGWHVTPAHKLVGVGVGVVAFDPSCDKAIDEKKIGEFNVAINKIEIVTKTFSLRIN